MKIYSTVILILLMAVSASFGAKLISYTGYSAESQEEANNAAIAGVAKQISAQVSSSQKLVKKEVKRAPHLLFKRFSVFKPSRIESLIKRDSSFSKTKARA